MRVTGVPSPIRRASVWRPQRLPEVVGLDRLRDISGIRWFELACGPDQVEVIQDLLGDFCPGLSEQMLTDLLTPDEEPEGASYGVGEIRLASSFSVEARRSPGSGERGTASGVGVLVFQPIELLAGTEWLITCRHPARTFSGAEKVAEGEPCGDDELFQAVAGRWAQESGGSGGDLGVSVMFELALTYAPTHRALYAWLEDWELSLYVEDDLNNGDQLPELWGLMAVLRNWLNPLNRAGLRVDLGKAWLPATNLKAVVEVDDRVDKALSSLARLSETLRQSFGLLHLEQTELQRQHSERMQHRIEAAAAIFLVPTLIVGFYGANTWVPGQGQHWGFWVMVAALVLLSVGALIAVVHLQRRSAASARKAASERERLRRELVRST